MRLFGALIITKAVFKSSISTLSFFLSSSFMCSFFHFLSLTSIPSLLFHKRCNFRATGSQSLTANPLQNQLFLVLHMAFTHLAALLARWKCKFLLMLVTLCHDVTYQETAVLVLSTFSTYVLFPVKYDISTKTSEMTLELRFLLPVCDL